MNWLYCIICILLAHLVGIGIGRVKQDNGKYYIQNFIAGYLVVIIFIIIYLVIN